MRVHTHTLSVLSFVAKGAISGCGHELLFNLILLQTCTKIFPTHLMLLQRPRFHLRPAHSNDPFRHRRQWKRTTTMETSTREWTISTCHHHPRLNVHPPSQQRNRPKNTTLLPPPPTSLRLAFLPATWTPQPLPYPHAHLPCPPSLKSMNPPGPLRRPRRRKRRLHP